ncbi:MAG TPA: hypothetical protein DDW76_20835 [Cyanobacteria bacterium UBA11369]|nr:hypothetical protein [Cyanobacteria bacterium UBA11368]HBE51148.1 hypothetical protein [Cyanobacteria bacterium UBA11369]
MGLVGGFGGVGIGMAPVAAAGGVVGAAAFGAFCAIGEGDAAAFGAIGLGAVGGIGVSSAIGGMGLSFGGAAVGIGIGTMAAAGGVFGLAAYGIAKLIDQAGSGETAAQAFSRMEEKVLQMEAYTSALMELMELEAELSGEAWMQKFAALEIEDELKALKAQSRKKNSSYFNFSPSNSLTLRFTPVFQHGNTPNSSQQDSQSTRADIPEQTLSITSKNPENWCCINTLKGHSGSVNSLAISRDGETIASASDDKTVILWNLKTSKRVWTFVGSSQEVYAVAISPDNQAIASGDFDRKITRWNLPNKELIGTLFYLNNPYSHSGFVYSLAFSPDGKTIVSGSADKTIRLWQPDTGKLKRTLNGHSEAVLSVAISPDSKIVISGSADKTIRFWDLSSGKQTRILTGHSGSITSIAISPDGQIMASGSTDGTIKLWNLHAGELLRTFSGQGVAIFSVAISPNGEIIASGSKKEIKLWNLSNGELLHALSGRYPVAFSADGQTLVSGGEGSNIKIWRKSVMSELTPDSVLSGEWWEVLGVNKNTAAEEVKLAYRRLARHYHPDVNPSANAKANIQAIVEAYKKFRHQRV